MSPAGGHLGFSIGPKSNNTWLQCSGQLLLFFVLIGYPIWLPGAIIASDWLKFQRSSSPAILDNRSEQKITTIDQNIVRNISAMHSSNPLSGS
jgi:hypothetical protein